MKATKNKISSKIKSKVNFGYADVSIEGIEKTEFYAHSAVDDLTGFKNTIIWSKLYNYQKDAAIGIINKLEKGKTPYTKDNITYGGNPELEFIGDPRTQNSYGVYEKPIAKVAGTYKPGIINATGSSFDEILKIVKSGRPVLAWTSMGLSTPHISTSWIYEPTGETIYWKSGEHAVVIIGYTTDKIIISDPIGGKIKYQSLSLFRERYNYFGKKALYY